MKKTFLILILLASRLIFAFQITGNPKNWTINDFIGYDKIGDNLQKIGDISSLFAKSENDSIFLRITFDDMITRHHNKIISDNYKNKNINITVKIKKNQKLLKQLDFSLADISKHHSNYRFLRTPENNILEIAILNKNNYDLTSLTLSISVYFNGKISDSLKKNVGNRDGGGNCAFLHHGNQGLTYTEVFYGQYPQDTSGFDEILQVHQATGIPGNFHMSGTLMSAAAWHNPEFNSWLAQGVNDGWVAMVTSALGQHIMPFVNNDMNNWSVKIETDMIRYHYNYDAKVAWIPERVWLSQNQYPNNGVIDWLGDNFTQFGIKGIVLDDWPHLNGANNEKIHWMNNGAGINLRVIPIDNNFVGKVHYDRDAAKNLIWNTGQYQIAVYATDWEVAAEMNENHDTARLDNYENIIWWCHDNYPAVNVWKLDAALDNSDFNGTGVDISNGTYGILGGTEGYGGSNNSWYNIWAGTPSHSDFHNPKWNYGYIWNDAFNNLSSAPDNSLAQLGWYTMMINLHETGWQEGGEIASWEHRYSSHIKNSNVYTEASRWAAGQYTQTTAAYFSDIDHDGGNELVMYNDKIFAVFEGIGGKINWLFYKDGYGNAYSVVSSDVAYWAETDGDYNESNYNHYAALSDVNPNQQSAIYDVSIQQSTGETVQATLSQWGVKKTIRLETGKNYLDVIYDFFGATGYIKSGFSPDLLDLIWSGKSHLQRLYGEYAKYVGWRNSSSGASVAYVLGSAGGSHNGEFEGTLIKGDEIYGTGLFSFRLFAGYTSQPYGTGVSELNELADNTVDLFGPRLESALFLSSEILQIKFNEEVTKETAENIQNYTLSNFNTSTNVISAKLIEGKTVLLKTDRAVSQTESGKITVNNVKDLTGNITDTNYNTISNITFISQNKIPHLVGNFNSWNVSDHTYDLTINENGIWTLSHNFSSGNYEYKISESESWNGNDWPGTNQSFNISSSSQVTFYVNAGATIGNKSGDEYVFHSLNPPCVIGDFLSELGGTDWDETSTITQMNDNGTNGDNTANDGIYSFKTLIPSGNYEFKIVLNNNWDQNTSGVNFAFTSDGIQQTLFTYDMSQNSTAVSQVTIFYPPTNLTANMQVDAILLTWQAPASKDLAYYKIYRDNTLLDTTSSTSYLDTNITDETNYSYKISAIYQSPSGESDYSDTVNIQALFQHKISGVTFLDKTVSSFSNIANNEILPSGSSIDIECKINGADIHSNSNFVVTLYYKIDNGSWQTKNFDWYSNADTLSYWRIELAHNVEIQNGDSISFYIQASDYTGTNHTDDNNSAYYHANILGIAQPVSVTFKLKLGGLQADSVAICGNQSPLDWTLGNTVMQYDSLLYLYTKTVTFPESSNDTIQYKYGRYVNYEWHWENFEGNREFVINDSDSTQTLSIDNWSNLSFPDLYNITFLDSTISSFSNVINNSYLPSGANIKIEAEIDGCDIEAVSGFQAKIIYKVNNGNWLEKLLYWESNNETANKSYWRIILENEDDFSNGDSLQFYLQATDYNGPVFTDNNSGNFYKIHISTEGLSQQTEVTFNVNMGAISSDSVAVFGNVYPLSWLNPTYLNDANNDKTFNVSVSFPQNSSKTVSYKYKRYDSSQQRWIWETVDNRTFIIDENTANQTNDNWNNLNIVELSQITFIPDSLSDYTNFNNQQTVSLSDSIRFELKLNNADYDACSGFQATLHYKTATTWETIQLDWYSNYQNNSYWRTAISKDSLSNANSMEFYFSATDYNGPTVYDNNSNNNYFVFFQNPYTIQDVTVLFTLDLVSESADSVSIAGNTYPLSWDANSNILTQTGTNYQISLLFPQGSQKSVQYKYTIFKNGSWQWESSNNRTFEIDDSSSNQTLSTDYWNNGSLSQISGITFLDKNSSSYTNFLNNDTLATGSSINFETMVNGADENANSEFNISLYYTKNDSIWNVKSFNWYSNDLPNNKSYWRTELQNPNEIANGEYIKFYLKASDYTQTQFIDDNNGAYYYVYISDNGLSQNVNVTFRLNVGAFSPDSVSIQGNTAPLSWSIGSNIMTENDKIYSITLLFAQGQNKSIEYKFGAYYSNEWHWEDFSGNRSAIINDTDTTYTLSIDYWNNQTVADINGVHFLEKSYPSEYTNFDNNESLSDADTLKFEVEVLGADINSNSGFDIKLYYFKDSLWTYKQFSWFSNSLETKDNRSYWRCELYKNSDFLYGDEIKFYITAIDYNGPEYSDKSQLNPYKVYIGKPAIPQNVSITKINEGFRIDWDEVNGATYNIYRSENATQGFVLWKTSVTATSVIDTTSANKRFYYIKAVK